MYSKRKNKDSELILEIYHMHIFDTLNPLHSSSRIAEQRNIFLVLACGRIVVSLSIILDSVHVGIR
jgi:hypothetical protein